MLSARCAVLDDLVEVAGQHLDRLVDLLALVASNVASAGAAVLFQLIEQLDREPGKVIDEVQRVLDLVGDAGGQLAERRHLLGLDQAGLRGSAGRVGRLGGISGGADFGFDCACAR